VRDCFEIDAVDAAGRIGELTVPRAGVTVETPALLPVINPNIETVSPADMESAFGVEMLITNAYIVHGNEGLRERAREEGLHELLDFSGAIMTDSGAFQLSEYGEIDVTTEEILAFQREIGSDVATPVDLPTSPDASRERAESDLATTTERLGTAEAVDTGEMLVTAPVQGATYPDLREQAARDAYATDLDVFPIGAVVPLLGDYRFAELVDVVAAAKRGLGADAPVHLFGAGHPMMFALAAAAGCDLFDSAAYAIYARDDRYMTVRGTEHLADLAYLPCACPTCSAHAPADLRALDDRERERRLAEHNLSVSFAEIRRVRQAIRAGNLLELVEARARGHPALLAGYRALRSRLQGHVLLLLHGERRPPAGRALPGSTGAPGRRRRPPPRQRGRPLGGPRRVLGPPAALRPGTAGALAGLPAHGGGARAARSAAARAGRGGGRPARVGEPRGPAHRRAPRVGRPAAVPPPGRRRGGRSDVGPADLTGGGGGAGAP